MRPFSIISSILPPSTEEVIIFCGIKDYYWFLFFCAHFNNPFSLASLIIISGPQAFSLRLLSLFKHISNGVSLQSIISIFFVRRFHLVISLCFKLVLSIITFQLLYIKDDTILYSIFCIIFSYSLDHI